MIRRTDSREQKSINLLDTLGLFAEIGIEGERS
mgnify:CR=1 FL=1